MQETGAGWAINMALSGCLRNVTEERCRLQNVKEKVVRQAELEGIYLER